MLALLAWLLPGFSFGDPDSVVATALLMTGAQTLAWPTIYRLAGLIHPLLFPIVTFLLVGVVVIVASDLQDGMGLGKVHVDGLPTAVLVAVGLTGGSTLLGAFFSLQDEDAFDWFVTRPLLHAYAGSPRSTDPGTMFLEIDGLAAPVLRRAIAEGYLPTFARWLDEGSHRLVQWEPDLSSQTSASQAGILLGHNDDIPAFRWYDKETRRIVLSSRMGTARDLERTLSSGDGLLVGGASRWNVFSGDAADSICTFSTVGVRGRGRTERYLAYFTNPYTLPRAVGLFTGDIVRERWQAWRQVRRGERPRIHRGLVYALVRAATTTVMQEAAIFMLLGDMARGVPVAYTTFFAYDEVAHHSGIDRPDAFKTLAKLDEAFSRLERAAARAARPYHLVVLSDHGQSMGATFSQRAGESLAQLVRRSVAEDASVTADLRPRENLGRVGVALDEVIRVDHRLGRLLQRALRRHTVDGNLTLDRDDPTAAHETDVVVLASGSLGLISFPGETGRLTHERIVATYPDLLPALVGHEAIAFVMVRSESRGALAIGASGSHAVETGRVEGEDPLTDYGPHAAAHLRRTDSFANAPDILVMGRYDPATDEVPAFEELVGSHGGLGGAQTQPFVLHPAELDPGDAPIVGAVALHRVLVGWTPIGRRIDR